MLPLILPGSRYGSKYVGAIHGRFLTFAAVATVLGPTLLLNLKNIAENKAITGESDTEALTEK